MLDPPSAELPPIIVDRRVAVARQRLDGDEAMIIADASDLRWLTGFTGSNGWAVLTPSDLTLVTDGRYGDQAAAQLTAARAPADVRLGATQAAIRDHVVATARGAARVTAEAGHVSHAEWTALAAQLDLRPGAGVVGALRRRKDDAELARIARAARIAEAALGEVVDMLAGEPTEADVRDELEHRMRRHGADGPSYETIVASGPSQSARPHHRPNRRTIVEGDDVVIDVGALVDGYHSDMTRTFVVGEPSAEQLERYDAVLESQAAGLAALAPGVVSTDVDRACREALVRRRLGELFVHGTGHGVGLDIHEDPFLRSTGETTLADGEVVTVEPGVYRDGSGGVRIEDLVTLTADGHRSLTSFPKVSPCLPSRPTT